MRQPYASVDSRNRRLRDSKLSRYRRDCDPREARKDNAHFAFDFALDRPFRLGERMRIIPKLEIFNLFNNKNNVIPITSPTLFDFNGFLRLGVGDPRQAQLSARFEF